MAGRLKCFANTFPTSAGSNCPFFVFIYSITLLQCNGVNEHKKGQFEPAEVGKLNEKHFSSGLKSRRRTYLTILKLADHALFKIVWYVLLRPLRPELDGRPSSAKFSYSCTKLVTTIYLLH
jgi:hypothetical protein